MVRLVDSLLVDDFCVEILLVMGISKFEDLIAWQKSQDIAVVIYEKFRDSRDFGFKDQICRAVVSISNNIAEGFERKGKKEIR